MACCEACAKSGFEGTCGACASPAGCAAPAGAAVLPGPQVPLTLPGLVPPFVVPEAPAPFVQKTTPPVARPQRVSFLRGAAVREVLDPRMPPGVQTLGVLPAGSVRPVSMVRPAGDALEDLQRELDAQRASDPFGGYSGAELIGGSTTPSTPATPTSPGLSQAQASTIAAGITGATSVIGNIFSLVSADNQRMADARTRELAAQMQQTQLRLQAENAAGNREQALRLAELQMSHQRELATIAASNGNTALQQQLSVAQQTLAAQQAALSATSTPTTPASTVPVWMYVAGAVALVGVGGAVIYAIAKKDDDDDAGAPALPASASAREDMRAELARRRQEIRARIEKMRRRA